MLVVILLAVGSALIISLAATWIVRRQARARGFIDHPGGHKEHAEPVALGGGVAIFTGFILPVVGGTALARIALSTGMEHRFPELIATHLPGIAGKLGLLLSIVAGAVVLHVIGLIDDRRPLGPGIKFAAQVIVALWVTAACGVRAAEFLGPVPATLLTTLWIVLIINAFNFLDNIDGLSAGVGLITAAIFACASARGGQIFVPTMAWVLVGALLGFLVFNFPPATIFMGDAGSMVIGYLLAVLTIMTTYYDPAQDTRPAGVLVPIIVLAVPLYDVASVVVHRLLAGASPFRGDRRHFSHRLVRRGMTTREAVMTIYLATAATSLGAILLPRANLLTALLIAAQCLCVVLIIAVLEHVSDRASSG